MQCRNDLVNIKSLPSFKTRSYNRKASIVLRQPKMTENNNNHLTAEQALDLATRVFLKEWTLLKPDDIAIEKLSGGFSNTIWLISRNDKKSAIEPSQVIIRVGGGNLMREAIKDFCSTTVVEELLIYNEVSKYGCGPKLYGFFGESMVVEYVDCVKLTPSLASTPEILRDVAKCYARYHSMDLPFDRRGFDVLEKMRERISMVPIAKMKSLWNSVKESLKDRINDLQDVDFFLDYPLDKELESLGSIKKRVNSRVVMSHGDSNFLNRLVRKTVTGDELRVIFCDFELSNYCERAYDIGGHFCNYMFQWDQEDQLTGHSLPEVEERRQFLKHYLDETMRLGYIEDFDLTGRDSIDNLMKESGYGILVYHLFILGFMRHSFSTYIQVHPNFANMFRCLINEYVKLKEEFLKTYGEKI